VIGAIADDLTGAAEIGAIGLRYGLRAEIFLSPGALSASCMQFAGAAEREQLFCLDTDSRGCEPGEAARRASVAAAALQECGCEWIYKKVDSVLRGNVTAELEAIMQRLGPTRCILVPANPALGRVIRDGQYYVHELPIDQTEFARDPTHPRLSSDVLKLLSSSALFPVTFCRQNEPFPSPGIAIGEAASAQHLQHWAAQRNKETMVAGGGEFIAHLLTATGRMAARIAGSVSPLPSARCLLVTGTTSQSSREFVRNARAKGVPVLSLPDTCASGAGVKPHDLEELARQAVKSLARNPRLILEVGFPFINDRSVACRLHVHLARVAELVIRQVGLSCVYVEGGATAVELMRRMNWNHLTMLAEVAHGVATLGVSEAPNLQLTMKPGSYQWPAEVKATFLETEPVN